MTTETEAFARDLVNACLYRNRVSPNNFIMYLDDAVNGFVKQIEPLIRRREIEARLDEIDRYTFTVRSPYPTALVEITDGRKERIAELTEELRSLK